MNPKQKIYFMPSLIRGNGTGHLRRSILWASELPGSILSVPEADKAGFFSFEEIEKLADGVLSQDKIERQLPQAVPHLPPPLIILDRRETSSELLKSLPRGSRFAAVDEGSSLRSRMDYLFDILPGRQYKDAPNLSGITLLPGPSVKRDEFAKKLEKLLITFGGEDPANLTETILKDFSTLKDDEESLPEIWVCRTASTPEFLPSWVKELPPTGDLKNKLADFDLVITSFGLTPFEALRAGSAVLILDPGSYHRELTANSALPSLGKGGVEILKERLTSFSVLAQSCADFGLFEPSGVNEKEASFSLTNWLGILDFPLINCPGCGCTKGQHWVLERFIQRTFRLCPACGMVYQQRHLDDETEYGKEYFFEEYAKQYGRTYLDDFSHLRGLARGRIEILKKFLPRGAAILDVGCAYGAFLTEAADSGFDPVGVDVAPSAVSWVQQELGLEAMLIPAQGLESFDILPKSPIHGVTLWYVIEHITDLKKLLEVFSKEQVRGDVLSFSTPNYDGVSRRRSRRLFLSRSPEDHHHIWSPRIARSVLSLYGYRIRKVRVTGHHPERFPGSPEKGSLLFSIWMIVSRLLRLGDTFECYAQKV